MKSIGFIAIIVLLLGSCGPRIFDFNPRPLTITRNDSVLLSWHVRGKPVLIVHDKQLSNSSTDTLFYKEFTLVVTKNGKEIKSKKQVVVLPKVSTEFIVFNTIVKGDTLVAEGLANDELWNNNVIISLISSASNRKLIVIHASIMAALDAAGTSSDAFKGTAIAGKWQFRSLLTTEEKLDLSLAPATLKISAIIIYKP